jgi:serine protease Do
VIMRNRISVYFAVVIVSSAVGGSLRDNPTSQAERETPVVKVYAKTHNAVVNISGQQTVTRSAWPQFDWPDMFDLRGPQFQQQVPVLGSGFIVHEDGYVVTNAHVVADVRQLKAVFSDGREFRAEVVSEDTSKDLAVLVLQGAKELPFVELGRSSDLMIGETVIAIGNPFGYSNTVTSGIVSAVGRDLQVTQGYWLRGLIQTDASINPGNSGGPLLNIYGELIGINTAIRPDAQNIGFAIPVDTLVENLSQMLMPEKLRRVRLGLTMGRMKTQGSLTGLVVDAVSKGSPADEKSLGAGDLILEVDGHSLHSVIDFYVKLMHKEVGEPIRLTYVRHDDPKSTRQVADLTLLPRPLPDGRLLARQVFQMEVQPMTEQVARRFHFEGAYPILVVTDTQRGGAADSAGLRSGDLILQIDDTTVRDITEFSREMEKVAPGDRVNFKVLRISLGVFGQIDRQLLITVEALQPTDSSRL